ncbi:MAG TPA: hypothetical protein PLL78_12770, partial [Fimbriimonadaceae bacterium]|nr:hypothetical protein [Fimbriimonadaceae bacterium]
MEVVEERIHREVAPSRVLDKGGRLDIRLARVAAVAFAAGGDNLDSDPVYADRSLGPGHRGCGVAAA